MLASLEKMQTNRILDIGTTLLNPYLKRTPSFPNVTFATGAFNLVDPFVLTMVRSVFHGSHFLFDGFHWFERGLDLFSSQYLGNHVGDPLNVR